MDMKLKEDFITSWRKYFNNAELPITFYYTDEKDRAEFAGPESTARCIVGALKKVREGESFTFNDESVRCPGGKRYLGFSENLSPDFEYFLSYGIPGKLEGERYKKNPETVREYSQHSPKFKAPGRYIVFKRWDMLKEKDTPEVVIFFARPDVLSGLYTLANYDTVDLNSVIAPWGSGCSSIVQNPYLEKDSPKQRAVIGMFDVSARPFVAPDELSFSVPIKKFADMVGNMEESFLITNSWKVIQKRIK